MELGEENHPKEDKKGKKKKHGLAGYFLKWHEMVSQCGFDLHFSNDQ